MDYKELQLGISRLPAEAQTKPLLAAMADQIERLSSNPAIAALQQEVGGLKAKATATPQHQAGLCQDSGCGTCVLASQEFVSAGRQSFMGNLDSALYWANRRDIAEIVTEIFGAWVQAGRPPAPLPAAV